MKVIVLGSGVIGVASAYFLAQDGHEVTVIDKAKVVVALVCPRFCNSLVELKSPVLAKVVPVRDKPVPAV